MVCSIVNFVTKIFQEFVLFDNLKAFSMFFLLRHQLNVDHDDITNVIHLTSNKEELFFC